MKAWRPAPGALVQLHFSLWHMISLSAHSAIFDFPWVVENVLARYKARVGQGVGQGV